MKLVFGTLTRATARWQRLGALLTEQHEIWSTGYKYFDMTAYWDWRNPQATAAD